MARWYEGTLRNARIKIFNISSLLRFLILYNDGKKKRKGKIIKNLDVAIDSGDSSLVAILIIT
jgi:hypothetical protein